jgi:predicted ester cyclase
MVEDLVAGSGIESTGGEHDLEGVPGQPGVMADAKTVVNELLRRQAEGDDTVLDELVADDLVNHAAGPQGREGLRQILNIIREDLGDVDVEELHLIAEGDLVAQHVVLRGAHRGSTMPLLAGTEPSGAEVTWTFIHLWRVVDGQIVEHWACRDDLGLLGQVGAWPPRPSSPPG